MSVIATAVVVALAATGGVLVGALLVLWLLVMLASPPRKE